MSAERRLSTAVFGKHPGFGDFLSAGDLPANGIQLIMDLLADRFGIWREAAGPDWQAIFDAAPALRFWIGAGPGRGASLRGVAAPSQDRSGRRYPLIIAQGPAGTAPVSDPDQTFYEATETELIRLATTERFNPRDIADQLSSNLPVPDDSGTISGAGFWAANPSRPPQELLAELAATDFVHAQAGRSYWWFAARPEHGLPSGMLASAGLPGPAEIGWLLSGGRTHGQPDPNQQGDST
ncbi:MAG: type VI secretion system-associated protein TagF [Paracoccus sp. (in: a-proteobacteria)]